MHALAHGWELIAGRAASVRTIREFLRPAVRAVPPAMALRLGPCRILLVEGLENRRIASQWTARKDMLEISVAFRGRDDHDIALEVLVCLGQALWEKLPKARRTAWWEVLHGEVRAGVPGEIDQDALKAKSALLRSRKDAASPVRLEQYGSASFAGTAAEYVHSLWHDVTVRRGPTHLPAGPLQQRLQWFAGWFPPGRGYRLFGRR
jgi:hypothetical protein